VRRVLGDLGRVERGEDVRGLPGQPDAGDVVQWQVVVEGFLGDGADFVVGLPERDARVDEPFGEVGGRGLPVDGAFVHPLRHRLGALDHEPQQDDGVGRGLERRPRRGLRSVGVTVREYEVLQLLADNMGNKDIARRLHISPRTVEKHVASLMAKSNLQNRGELTEYARNTPH
jgi:DNA-binding CsgD family transcriptional regulator